MSNKKVANRIELDSQILRAALHCSSSNSDFTDVLKACKGLYFLHPDLLPISESPEIAKCKNFYEVLSVDCEANTKAARTAYLRKIKSFLRKYPDAQENVETFFEILDAGTVLQNFRLRISHDLTLSRAKLVVQNHIKSNGTFDEKETKQELLFEPNSDDMFAIPPIDSELPKLIQLMKASDLVTDVEVQALLNKMRRYPEIPLEEIIISSRYISEVQLNSLKLAEYLLKQGKISNRQFSLAEDEE